MSSFKRNVVISNSANQFGIELFQCYLKRHGDKHKNLLLCPYLIYHSLAMLLVGAKDNTSQQLIKLLKIPIQMTDQTKTKQIESVDVNLKANEHDNADQSEHRKSRSALRKSKHRSLSRKSKSSPSATSVSSTGSFSSGSSLNSSASSRNRSSSRSSRRSNSAQRKKSPENSSKVKSAGLAKGIHQQKSSVQATESKKDRNILKSERLTPDGPDEPRHREFLTLTEQLIHGNHDFVHLASFIYLDKGAKRTERFKAILRDYYETKPKKVDFSNSDLLTKTINEDVARTTENIYNDILSKQEAQKLEKSYMLLVNAVFFRGFWLSNFTDVKKAPFKICKPLSNNVTKDEIPDQQVANPASANDTCNIDVNMMSKLDHLPVVSDERLDARIIKMPFEASDLQMLLILPNGSGKNSNYLCDLISAQWIDSIMDKFEKSKSRPVQISMPIFCIDSGKISLQSTLVKMGASDLFDKTKATMSGICENKQVWLDKILHRCFMICDNRGAITSSSFEKARKQRKLKVDGACSPGGRPGIDEFVVDHPFMYIIMDSLTRTILLIGLYTDPKETLEVIHENQLSSEEAHQIYTEGVYKT